MSNPFTPKATESSVTVIRKEKKNAFSISMTPVEVEKATFIVNIALSMANMETVPDHITNSPFVIRFFNNDQYALERNDADGSVPFKGFEGDELIKTLNDAKQIAINAKRFSSRPSIGFSKTDTIDEPFI